MCVSTCVDLDLPVYLVTLFGPLCLPTGMALVLCLLASIPFNLDLGILSHCAPGRVQHSKNELFTRKRTLVLVNVSGGQVETVGR